MPSNMTARQFAVSLVAGLALGVAMLTLFTMTALAIVHVVFK